jgi:tRNA(Ile)-lysidine synthase
LRQFVQARRIQFREDASNASLGILRNRVRHELLPLLRRRFQPGVDRTILRMADILRADAESLDGAAVAWLKLDPTKRRIANEPVGLQRRILQLQLREQGFPCGFDLIELIRESPGQPVMLARGLSVKCDDSGSISRVMGKAQRFTPGRMELKLAGKSGVLAFNGTEISWRKVEVSGATLGRRPVNLETFDADKVGAHIVLRHWEAGDRFQPIGMRAAVKLQDWFTNRKIPQEQRRRLIVGATWGGEIFWVEGERMAERFKLTSKTRRRLIWSWKRAETT